ncbi:MAG: type II/IV secretion system protein [Kiritimatiellae bacterium]|nr:type II/IV secretion system protein [Kiritimatiellia bacterium]
MANKDKFASDSVLSALFEAGTLDKAACEEIFEEHERTGKETRDIVTDGQYVSEDDLLESLASGSGAEIVPLSGIDIDPEVLKTLTGTQARLYNVVPVEADPATVTLATFTVPGPDVADALSFALGREIRFAYARKQEVLDCISRYYGAQESSADNYLAFAEFETGAATEDEEMDEKKMAEAASSAPVVRLVQLVLNQAVQARASDIHFEPFEKEFKIRYRVDGALYEMTAPPKSLATPVISRIKVLSGLNIAERRLPQDGRIELPVGGRVIDLRVSCLPTQFGESVVLRVLDRSVVSLDLENLGMPEDVYDNICRDIDKPNGIVIVTGPTGSGKTTTLYSCLRRINKEGTKILTAEEPVEYDIDGLVQVPINPIQGNTFPLVLRAFLRQDPDVIMVGEIRDLETAQIAVQASLTGHLVFSTLHTNDAAGAVTRLIDMDVAPYLISSTLNACLGQRLVRRICKNCRTEYEPTPEILQRLNLTADQVAGRKFAFGAGCDVCNKSGYKGRTGLYEYLTVTDPIRVMITEKKPTLVIREKARELGMRTMREDGVRNVLDGVTTVDEVLRYT